jgi:uncharacterized protein (DUF1697 family)
MSRQIAFLRAINVGGHTITMDALRAQFIALGFADVETFIASGNLIFTTPGKPTAALEQRIEAQLAAALGYPVATFLRTPAELAAVLAARPFPAAQMAAAVAFNVGFLKAPLAPAALARLKGLETKLDAFAVQGREVYWLCRVKQSESRFANAVFEKTLSLTATWRGINTLQRLSAKYPPG